MHVPGITQKDKSFSRQFGKPFDIFELFFQEQKFLSVLDFKIIMLFIVKKYVKFIKLFLKTGGFL